MSRWLLLQLAASQILGSDKHLYSAATRPRCGSRSVPVPLTLAATP